MKAIYAIKAIKWGPLPPNDVGRIVQNISQRGGREGEKERMTSKRDFILPVEPWAAAIESLMVVWWHHKLSYMLIVQHKEI